MRINHVITKVHLLGGVLVLGMAIGIASAAHAQGYDDNMNVMGSNRDTGGATQEDYNAMAAIQAQIAAQREEATREAAEEHAAQANQGTSK